MSATAVESIDFNKTVPEWHVLNNEQNCNSTRKRELMGLIRTLIDVADSNSMYPLRDPFADCETLADLQSDESRVCALKTVISFLYHYCRSEIGCHAKFEFDPRTVQVWTERLQEAESE